MIRESEIINNILHGNVAGYVEPTFGLPGLGWVPDFVRDLDHRKRIQAARDRIKETGALPMHVDELRAQFENRVEDLNRFRLQQLKSNLEAFQKHESHLINDHHLEGARLLGSTFAPFFMAFSETDMAFLFEGLPEGVTLAEKARRVKECQAEILDLQKVIDKELSPKSRWWHTPKGDPIPYPQGCRWTAFANVWRKVAERFNAPVDINGARHPTDACSEAYNLLGLTPARGWESRKPMRRVGDLA